MYGSWRISEKGLTNLKIQLLQVTGVENPTKRDIETLEKLANDLKATSGMYVGGDIPVSYTLPGTVTLNKESASISLTLGDFYYVPVI